MPLQVFNPGFEARVRPGGIETEDLHLAVIARIEIAGDRVSLPSQRLPADATQNGCGAVSARRGGKTDASSQHPREAEHRQGNAQRVAGASKLRSKRPSAHLHVIDAGTLGELDLGLDRLLKPGCPVHGSTEGRLRHRRIGKTHAAGMRDVTRTAADLTAAIHSDQMPGPLIPYL